MANARIDRKGFLKGLGVAAAACTVRPAKSVAAQIGAANPVGAIQSLPLPRKTQAATRIVAYRAGSV